MIEICEPVIEVEAESPPVEPVPPVADETLIVDMVNGLCSNLLVEEIVK